MTLMNFCKLLFVFDLCGAIFSLKMLKSLWLTDLAPEQVSKLQIDKATRQGSIDLLKYMIVEVSSNTNTKK